MTFFYTDVNPLLRQNIIIFLVDLSDRWMRLRMKLESSYGFNIGVIIKALTKAFSVWSRDELTFYGNAVDHLGNADHTFAGGETRREFSFLNKWLIE